jgi:bifunctional ADP-heptose synthase (sugar kinase/adenylyltransferase)
MGARDMVVAIVAVGLALEIPVLDIAQLANVFANLVVQQHGNGTVTWKDLFRAIHIPQPEPVTS